MDNRSSVLKSEHEEQVNFVSMFRKLHKDVKIFAIPNGGQRNIIIAAKLKSEGVSKGVPDLFIPAWNLWIEMKREKKSSVSKDQKEWHEYLESIGHTVIVGYGCDDAIFKLNNLTFR